MPPRSPRRRGHSPRPSERALFGSGTRATSHCSSPSSAWSNAETWVRLPSVAAAVVAAIAAYRLGRRLAGRHAGAAASLVLASSVGVVSPSRSVGPLARARRDARVPCSPCGRTRQRRLVGGLRGQRGSPAAHASCGASAPAPRCSHWSWAPRGGAPARSPPSRRHARVALLPHRERDRPRRRGDGAGPSSSGRPGRGRARARLEPGGRWSSRCGESSRSSDGPRPTAGGSGSP